MGTRTDALVDGILLRLRCYKIVVTEDPEKAFLQVALRSEDRSTTRFLFVGDTAKQPTKVNLVTFRFQRIPFAAVSSPFILTAVVNHHLRKSKNTVAEELMRDTYVDNVFIGADNEIAAKRKVQQAKQFFASAGMKV